MAKSNGRKTILNRILIIIAVFLLVGIIGIWVSLLIRRPAVRTLDEYRTEFSDVTITVLDDDSVEVFPSSGSYTGDIANTNGEPAGIIFYTGAQIKPNAYIPLMAGLAEKGYYCFVPQLNFNMGSLEPAAADPFITEHPEIKSWYLAGHSMGGLTASGYVCDHREQVNGLILLAAYTNRDMSNSNIPTLSIYGDQDSVLNVKLYKERMTWNSNDFEEHIINGGNHAGFGDYGKQPRDTDATISADDQQKETVEIIDAWIRGRHF